MLLSDDEDELDNDNDVMSKWCKIVEHFLRKKKNNYKQYYKIFFDSCIIENKKYFEQKQDYQAEVCKVN